MRECLAGPLCSRGGHGADSRGRVLLEWRQRGLSEGDEQMSGVIALAFLIAFTTAFLYWFIRAPMWTYKWLPVAVFAFSIWVFS